MNLTISTPLDPTTTPLLSDYQAKVPIAGAFPRWPRAMRIVQSVQSLRFAPIPGSNMSPTGNFKPIASASPCIAILLSLSYFLLSLLLILLLLMLFGLLFLSFVVLVVVVVVANAVVVVVVGGGGVVADVIAFCMLSLKASPGRGANKCH